MSVRRPKQRSSVLAPTMLCMRCRLLRVRRQQRQRRLDLLLPTRQLSKLSLRLWKVLRRRPLPLASAPKKPPLLQPRRRQPLQRRRAIRRQQAQRQQRLLLPLLLPLQLLLLPLQLLLLPLLLLRLPMPLSRRPRSARVLRLSSPPSALALTKLRLRCKPLRRSVRVR